LLLAEHYVRELLAKAIDLFGSLLQQPGILAPFGVNCLSVCNLLRPLEQVVDDVRHASLLHQIGSGPGRADAAAGRAPTQQRRYDACLMPAADVRIAAYEIERAASPIS
jgi:hypothetical protein